MNPPTLVLSFFKTVKTTSTIVCKGRIHINGNDVPCNATYAGKLGKLSPLFQNQNLAICEMKLQKFGAGLSTFFVVLLVTRCQSRWENLDRGQYPFKRIKFLKSVVFNTALVYQSLTCFIKIYSISFHHCCL